MSMSCPIDTGQSSCIQLAHGGGGRKMRELIENSIYKYLAEENAERHHDAALVKGFDEMLLTTDSYVVNPLFFPGGDIGQLAVYGTVNDLCMAGATPRYLTLSFIIEEGLPLIDFEKILLSIATAARECDVSIVTGDTKVVERGNCDKLFINTAGVGKKSEHSIHPRQIQSGDSIILNGDLGRHGVAIMAARDQVECEVKSDIASLLPATASLLRSCKTIKCMRDLTRGGLASALNELAEYCQMGISIDQEKIPKHPEVESYCEILGLDSAYS